MCEKDPESDKNISHLHLQTCLKVMKINLVTFIYLTFKMKYLQWDI